MAEELCQFFFLILEDQKKQNKKETKRITPIE
jgi:preprotein translocase subunit YajC